jgi:sterol desaturase/sphingolipid hydroxylase (fatty acid hydroxylase superfamily)
VLYPKWLFWVTAADGFFAIGLTCSIFAIYILANGFFMALDEVQVASQFKMPRESWMEPKPELINMALQKQALAHLVTGPAIMLLVAGPGLRAINAHADIVSPQTFPSAATMFVQFGIVLIVNDTMFYMGHRLLHTKTLYRLVHKQHHSYVATKSIASEHAHPAEQVLTAYIPFLAGLILTKAHFHVVFIWFFCRLIQVYEAHSGYYFGSVDVARGYKLNVSLFLGGYPHGAALHDFHHTRNIGGFGWDFLDYIFGTMDVWVAEGGLDGYLQAGGNKRNQKKDR